MKLSPEKIEECAQWVRENGLLEYGGGTINQFCEAQGITKPTYYSWLENITFFTAIKEAKETFKNNLEHDLVVSLAKMAKGYTFTKKRTEYKSRVEKDENGKTKLIKTPSKEIEEKVEVQPNLGAAIFLLTNINPEDWKNKQSTEVDANVKANIDADVVNYDPNELSDELKQQIADALQQKEFERAKARKNE